MRFARVLQTHDQSDAELAARVEAADLDVLQLDYLWPHAPPSEAQSARGLLEQLQTLHKSMFLNPQLHLVTNAGAGNVVGCAEAVAEYLCEHGDADLPLSVVRGDNLLPSLEQLQAEGVELRDQTTGQLVSELEQIPVAARVELGAGPFSTSWREGARMVISGSYDVAAPVSAAALAAFDWSWENHDALAQVSVATRMFDGVWQLGPDTEPILLKSWNRHGWDEDLEFLRRDADDGWLYSADVDCEVSQTRLNALPYQQMQIAGVHGRAGSQDWLAKLIFLSGHTAEAKLRLLTPNTELTKTTEQVRELLTSTLSTESSFQIEPMRFTKEHWWIFLRMQNESKEKCLEFLNAVNQLCHRAKIRDLELVEPPTCQSKYSTLSCPIPREVVAVSVDTRAAKEWR